MANELLRANLNLYAVIQNLEDLVKYDEEMNTLAKSWRISIQFSVRRGPKAFVAFENGVCTVGRGKHPSPSVILYFASPAHLNKMFDGKANPIPLWGFTKLGFLSKDFAKLTDRLTYFLKPTDELLKDPKYLAINTRLTLNTAGFAVPEIAKLDEVGQHAAGALKQGTVAMRILPDGPGVYIDMRDGELTTKKGVPDKPTACMFMKDIPMANAFLNGKTDAFTAIASGDVSIRGLLPQLDAMSLILDRVPHYLS